MQTIIGFDSWTGGSHNFARLVPALKARGLDLQLLHLGSWGSETGRPRQEVISGMRVRDISSFGRKGFLRIIDSERPAAVIFLSVDTFAHRAFNRYCRYRGIPTLHLYHGLVRVQDVDNNKPHKVNFFSQTYFVLSRLGKAFAKVWPTYIKSLVITGAPLSAWRRFICDIYNLTSGHYMPISALDARTDRGAVYVTGDVQHAIKKYGFSEETVSVVGNPDLVMFGLVNEIIGCGIEKQTVCLPEVMYIDTGLIYFGAVFGGADDFLEHLAVTKRGLETQGKTLIVKLHPHHYTTNFPTKLSEIGIELIQNAEFVRRLRNCSAAIVEPSTAAMIPALMGIPVLLARYGKLSQQAYGEMLTGYPRAIPLTDISEINYLLDEESKHCEPDTVAKWISENAGPLPAEQMPERVAAIVLEMIARKCTKVLY